MDDDTQDPSTSPVVDTLAGGFFLLWAAVGWSSFASNLSLRESLWASADPGPALLPLIVLTTVTLGGAVIGGRGLWRMRSEGASASGLPVARAHLLPAAFAASVVLATFMLRPAGFVLAAGTFCLVWLYTLSAGRRLSPRHAAVSICVAALLSVGLYLIFARVLMVPLPN